MEAIDAAVQGFMATHVAIKTVLGILTTGLIFGRARKWWSVRQGGTGGGGAGNFPK